MIAMNDCGQLLINDAHLARATNKIQIIKLILLALKDLDYKNIEATKNNIFRAHELTNESCRVAYIAVKGLVPMVANEESDAHNHYRLMNVSKELHDNIYVELFPLFQEIESHSGTNITSFHRQQVKRKLTDILHLFCETQ
ncbi:MAG: hypothetical protein NTW08_03620 [Gammaproteobacteria bacterium]|nr:hypothetical protein [Gammaproteobacteria bacterium]